MKMSKWASYDVQILGWWFRIVTGVDEDTMKIHAYRADSVFAGPPESIDELPADPEVWGSRDAINGYHVFTRAELFHKPMVAQHIGLIQHVFSKLSGGVDA